MRISDWSSDVCSSDLSRWDRGDRRSMCCVLDASAFSDLFEFDWEDKKLAASLDISNGFIRGTMMRLVGEALSPGFASELLVESLSTALAVELRRHFDIPDPEAVLREGGLSTSQVRRIRQLLGEEEANAPVHCSETTPREGLRSEQP